MSDTTTTTTATVEEPAPAKQIKQEDKKDDEPKKPEMYYRMLGNTGLQVSILGFGFWATYGSKGDLQKQDGIDRAKEILQIARDAGVNFFDNAETYGSPRGEAETIMGEAIVQLRKEKPQQWRRTDIVITTKLFWGGDGVNEKGLSSKHVREGMDAALKRLQTDYVDLVFCHRPDPLTPTENVVRHMTYLVRQGKATAWGTSEWSAQQITEAYWMAKMYGLEPPQFEQPQYHMYERKRFEREYEPLYRYPYKIGTTIWSPLASGLLTGKYNDTIPGGSRASSKGYEWVAKKVETWRKEGKIETVRKLTAYAQKTFNCTMTQLALAWCIKNKNVSTILLGATKKEQIVENLKCIDVAMKITDEHLKEIDEMLANKPDLAMNYGVPSLRFRPFKTI